MDADKRREMEEASGSEVPIRTASMKQGKANNSRQLYWEVMETVPDCEGYEARRRLHHSYDPRLPGRCAGMLLDPLRVNSCKVPLKCPRRSAGCTERRGNREFQGRSRAQELPGCRAPEALAEASCNPGQLLKKGKGKDGKGKKVKGKGKEQCQGDERRCFYYEGKGHIKSNCPQKVIDDKNRSDSKSSSSNLSETGGSQRT